MKPIKIDVREGQVNWQKILINREEVYRYFHNSINGVYGRYWIKEETEQLVRSEDESPSRAG